MHAKPVHTRESLLLILQALKVELATHYHVQEIGLFGSFVRGEGTDASDVDILVEFSHPVGLFKFLELEEYLQKVLGIKVDLVSKKALKPRIGQHIMNEVVLV